MLISKRHIVLNTVHIDAVFNLTNNKSTGLTNEEVAVADGIIAIPTYKHFSSLNLAQVQQKPQC